MSDFNDWSPEETEDVIAQLAEWDTSDRDSAILADTAGVVNWRELPDENAREVWIDLRGWVEWFSLRYQLGATVFPDCWWRHGQLVEELSALRAAHRALFDSADSGLGPIGWHERLPLAIERMKSASGSLPCRTAGAHKEKKSIREWTDAIDQDDWDAWTTQAHRQ